MTEKSKGLRDQSSKAQGEAQLGSVYDFLYHDARRIASFLSQFDKFGHLTSITKTETAGRSRDRGGSLNAQAGLPTVARAGGEVTTDTHTNYQQLAQRAYDPLWSNALNLLDYLAGKGLINRDLRNARLGQFVLVAGSLSVRDLRLLKQALNLPALRASYGAPVNTDSFHKSKGKRGNTSPASALNNEQFGFEFLQLLPHSVQAQVCGDGFEVWCSLGEEGLVVTPSELFLKHGVEIPGDWHVLGVLDAFPSTDDDDDPSEALQNALGSVPSGDPSTMIGIAMNGMGSLIDGIVPFARLLLGRRDREFGITPLLIFREIAA